MLTYVPLEQRFNHEARHEYPWLLILLVFAWLWPGVFSHDLWNPAEPQVFTIIEENARGGTIWLPTLFGEAYFSVAPFYIGLAKLCQLVFANYLNIMDNYSATRLASVIFTVIGLVGSGMAGSKMVGHYFGRSTVLILIGSAGLLSMAHFLSPMSVAFAGVGLAMWGFAIAHKQAIFAAFLLGLGMIFLGQSLGFLMAFSVFLVGFLASFHELWRNMRLKIVGLGALVWAIPILCLQPMILAKINPPVFHDYINHHVLGIFGGLNQIHLKFNLFYYIKHLLWFAFPAYPLAIWTIIKLKSKILSNKYSVLCMIWLMVFGGLLILNSQDYQENLIVLLPVLAILGSGQLDCLRRGAAAFLNWFGIMTFSLAAIFLWIGFMAMNYGFPAKLAARAAYFSPYYVPEIDMMPMIVAILFTPAWIIAITRKRIRGRQAVTNWAAGMTLVWALLLTLFLPFLDAAKSYRPIVSQMSIKLNQFNQINNLNNLDNLNNNCIYIAPEHHAAKIAWGQYFYQNNQINQNIKLEFNLNNLNNKNKCEFQLIQYNPKKLKENPDLKLEKLLKSAIWVGKRPRNKVEAFALIKIN